MRLILSLVLLLALPAGAQEDNTFLPTVLPGDDGFLDCLDCKQNLIFWIANEDVEKYIVAIPTTGNDLEWPVIQYYRSGIYSQYWAFGHEVSEDWEPPPKTRYDIWGPPEDQAIIAGYSEKMPRCVYLPIRKKTAKLKIR